MKKGLLNHVLKKKSGGLSDDQEQIWIIPGDVRDDVKQPWKQ